MAASLSWAAWRRLAAAGRDGTWGGVAAAVVGGGAAAGAYRTGGAEAPPGADVGADVAGETADAAEEMADAAETAGVSALAPAAVADLAPAAVVVPAGQTWTRRPGWQGGR